MQDIYGKPLPKETTRYHNLILFAKNVLYPHDRATVTPESVSLHHISASRVTPVSIVMPCYNAESTIAETVESILSMTFEKFELITVDGGSTDSTRDAVRSFKDRRVVLIENEHDFIGPLNLGMRRASGRYIARMDAGRNVAHPPAGTV